MKTCTSLKAIRVPLNTIKNEILLYSITLILSEFPAVIRNTSSEVGPLRTGAQRKLYLKVFTDKQIMKESSQGVFTYFCIYLIVYLSIYQFFYFMYHFVYVSINFFMYLFLYFSFNQVRFCLCLIRMNWWGNAQHHSPKICNVSLLTNLLITVYTYLTVMKSM